MPAYISLETRSRHSAAESFLEDTYKKLENSKIVVTLGERATSLLTIADSLYVPDVRHGEVHFPADSLRAEGIPLIIFFEDETLHLDPKFQRVPDYARQAMANYLQAIHPTIPSRRASAYANRAEIALKPQVEGNNTLHLSEGVSAEVIWNQYSVDVDVRPQPISIPYATNPILQVKSHYALKKHSGIMGIHELTHLQQARLAPIEIGIASQEYREQLAAQDELEAYKAEYDAINSLSPELPARAKSILYDTSSPYMEEVVTNNPGASSEELFKLFLNHPNVAKQTPAPLQNTPLTLK